MRIGGIYSFKNGQEIITERHGLELAEVQAVIKAIDVPKNKTLITQQKITPGKTPYEAASLDNVFSTVFEEKSWQKYRIYCDYPNAHPTNHYSLSQKMSRTYREISFVKNRVGVEMQFSKDVFKVANVCAQMTIFHNEDVIDVGIEIVPLKELADEMSSGISYFEQFVWDLEHRGTADIDIPILILGIIP